jgi:tetratricopeptide (TPR) repeat protein
LGLFKEALQDYNKSIELNPENSRAYNNRGTVYANTNRLYDAISDYSKAIELDNALADAYYNRGDVYFNQGKYS